MTILPRSRYKVKVSEGCAMSEGTMRMLMAACCSGFVEVFRASVTALTGSKVGGSATVLLVIFSVSSEECRLTVHGVSPIAES